MRNRHSHALHGCNEFRPRYPVDFLAVAELVPLLVVTRKKSKFHRSTEGSLQADDTTRAALVILRLDARPEDFDQPGDYFRVRGIGTRCDGPVIPPGFKPYLDLADIASVKGGDRRAAEKGIRDQYRGPENNYDSEPPLSSVTSLTNLQIPGLRIGVHHAINSLMICPPNCDSCLNRPAWK